MTDDKKITDLALERDKAKAERCKKDGIAVPASVVSALSGIKAPIKGRKAA